MTPASISTPSSGSLPGGLSLPPGVAAALWRGDELAAPGGTVVPTGFAALDAVLPGGGWPVGAVTELLQPQFSLAEAQLLLPAVALQAGPRRQVLVIGSPHEPFLAGWHAWGVQADCVLRVQPGTPAEALWVVEQALQASGIGAVLAWLPHAAPAQLRRLQSCATGGDFPVFLMRPQEAALHASAAPLRVGCRLAAPGQVGVHVLKRRGPPHDGELVLATAAPRLAALLRHRQRGALSDPIHEVVRVLDRADATPLRQAGFVRR